MGGHLLRPEQLVSAANRICAVARARGARTQPHKLTSIQLQAGIENALRSQGYPAEPSKSLARDITQAAEPVIFKAQMRRYTHPDAPR